MEPKVPRPCTVHQPTVCQFLHPHHHHGSYRQVPPPLNHHFHHHHHLHLSPQCPMHSFLLYSNYHSPECSLFTSHPKTVSSPPPPIVDSLPLSQPVEETAAAEVGLMNEEWEEEDEDPVFVLTDEWREFFAKSEAKRRQAKKQKAKLKGKETDG